MNATGDVVVGGSNTSDGERAFLWTQAGGMVDLGVLAGCAYSTAKSINSAGDVIVGFSDGCPGPAQIAFRWTAATGMQSIEQWLTANGGDVGSIPTVKAFNASDNAVVGSLSNQEAFLSPK